MGAKVDALVKQLNSFDSSERRSALEQLAEMARDGLVECKEERGWVNLHAHTFFSYNGYGYSPSRFAWEACREGLEVAGIVDFDCLDGTAEFLEAGQLLRMKTTAGFETRVFVEEYEDRVINSPREPGVFYLVGTGFVRKPEQKSEADKILSAMAQRARERNMNMLDRLNRHMSPLSVDYEKDVVPLTAAGNVTERHMVTAIESRAREAFGDGDELVQYWTEKLGVEPGTVQSVVEDPVALKGLVRSNLMKHGGVGYVKPDSDSFPNLEEVVQMTREQGALPSGCWLDGTSKGEKDPRDHFSFLKKKGCVSITIIPDRNWNVPSDVRDTKVRKLNEAIDAARELNMPVFVGTEMNKEGTKLVDDFNSEALAPHLDTFRRGAHICWGHTMLKMTAGVGYVGDWADAHFGSDMSAKNDYFESIGKVKYPVPDVLNQLAEIGSSGTPEDFRRTAIV